jgi:hypothetical protein
LGRARCIVASAFLVIGVFPLAGVAGAVRPSQSPEARCVVVPNGNAPAQYQCSAKVRVQSLDRGALFGLGTRVTFVDWEVTGP